MLLLLNLVFSLRCIVLNKKLCSLKNVSHLCTQKPIIVQQHRILLFVCCSKNRIEIHSTLITFNTTHFSHISIHPYINFYFLIIQLFYMFICVLSTIDKRV